jgi:hypothetical protein
VRYPVRVPSSAPKPARFLFTARSGASAWAPRRADEGPRRAAWRRAREDDHDRTARGVCGVGVEEKRRVVEEKRRASGGKIRSRTAE